MRSAVADKNAASGAGSPIDKIGCWISINSTDHIHTFCKVDKVSMVSIPILLYTVRIMAYKAWCLLVHNMLFMGKRAD
jgi:hypothetical protein